MSFDFGNLGALLEPMRKMQERLQKATEESHALVEEGAAAAGLVRVRATGAGTLLAVEIDPSLVARNDPALLADLVRGAANQALERARAAAQAHVRDALGGLPLPPGMIPGL